MLGYEKEQRSLTREQKQAVSILSIGTFLEYFDLMLYVHLAVLLNEIFFPKLEPHAASLLAAFTFCSTFVCRPIGAYIFGRLGDTLGRKSTVIITTTLMALTCGIMTVLPTYSQIGIMASIAITICRMIQGMSSMGEIIGAELYMTEITKPPIQYLSVALIGCLSAAGGMGALAIATFVTSNGLNWRYAFLAGAFIAIIGTVARKALRETPDFANAKKQLKVLLEHVNIDQEKLESNPIWKEKVKVKTFLSLFLMDCAWPVCFYFLYFYCSNILKNSFGYSAEEVIQHNFQVSVAHFSTTVLLIYLSYKIYPFKIVKARLMVFFGFALVCPYVISRVTSPNELLLIQLFFVLFRPDHSTGIPFKYFPIFKRFTSITLSFAISRAFMHIVTSFGFVYLIEYFGDWGLSVIMLPTAVAFLFGLSHFETLERKSGNYPEKSFFLSSKSA